jgi:uncharacterized membrane protein YeiB
MSERAPQEPAPIGRVTATAGESAPDGGPAPPAEDAGLGRGRIGGIDLARALAIVGMLAVHVGPTRLDDLAGRLYALPHGRASVLFVLVAGVGVALLAASRTRTAAAARWRLAWRGALLLPLGLLLQDLDHRVAVILPTYATLFVLAIVVLRLQDRLLLTLALGLSLVGPVVFLVGSTAYPEAFARSSVGWSDPAADVVIGVILGPYPLPVWAAPFLLGIWLGRRDLRSRAVRFALVLGGAAAAVLAPAAAALLAGAVGEPASPTAWHALLQGAPHSQMPPWLIGSLGSAALLLGASLFLADALPRLSAPFVAMGQLALTVYVAHLLALHAWSDVLRSGEVGEAVLIVLAFTAAAALAAVLWRRAFRRGPLEALLDVPWLLMVGQRGGAGPAGQREPRG